MLSTHLYTHPPSLYYIVVGRSASAVSLSVHAHPLANKRNVDTCVSATAVKEPIIRLVYRFGLSRPTRHQRDLTEFFSLSAIHFLISLPRFILYEFVRLSEIWETLWLADFFWHLWLVYKYMRECVCACVRAWVCMRTCVPACVCMYDNTMCAARFTKH